MLFFAHRMIKYYNCLDCLINTITNLLLNREYDEKTRHVHCKGPQASHEENAYRPDETLSAVFSTFTMHELIQTKCMVYVNGTSVSM